MNCTITNWNQVGGANVAIHPYVPLPQFGTRSAWDKFLGTGGIPADTSSCVTNANHVTPGETDDSYVHAIGDEANAIVAVSYGSYKSRFKKGSTFLPAHGVIGKVDGITANSKTLLAGTFPYSRYVYNVYCAPNNVSGSTACNGGTANQATQDYVGEEGWICKIVADHDTVPYTSPAVNYRTAITNAIKAAGFVPLNQGVIGSGNTNADFCRLFTH